MHSTKGRTEILPFNDDSIMELLMQVYYQTDYIDWEEINWLFTTYLQKGILDFPEAQKMAMKRIKEAR